MMGWFGSRDSGAAPAPSGNAGPVSRHFEYEYEKTKTDPEPESTATMAWNRDTQHRPELSAVQDRSGEDCQVAGNIPIILKDEKLGADESRAAGRWLQARLLFSVIAGGAPLW